nr:hypothetical protein [uncultured Flavobacterium sp.]
MNDIPGLLIDILSKKETETFKIFLESFGVEKKEWYLVSDYCIDDKNKLNDVFSFSLLLNHDNIHNIKDFLKTSAPKDLKNAKDISDSFLSYVNCPIGYHFSFVIPRESKLLKSYYSKERIIYELDYLNKTLEHSKPHYHKELVDYYIEVQKAIKQINIEALRATFNENLMRKILLTGIFGGAIMYLLKINSSPTKVMWISDRDAIIDKYDGFAYDWMFSMYNLLPTDKHLSKEPFEFIFNPSEASGHNFFDELIRIPDYLAGTLASMDLNDCKKFETMQHKHKTFLAGSITNSTNQANIKIEIKNSMLSMYNLKWVI